MSERKIDNYLKERNLNISVCYINDKYRDYEELPENEQKRILDEFKRLNITHCIISTEPKAHKAYISFCLKNHINILVDKPLTAPVNVINDYSQAKKIMDDYNEIVNLYKKANEDDNVLLQVQCQRRSHKGYRFVHDLVADMIKQYNIPITSMHISHCDGMWNMPDEFLTRENHPYKYGYGKLFHSGYHFIDLTAWFASLNDIIDEKRPDSVELYASPVKVDDFMEIINKNDYHALLKTAKFDNIFDNYNDYSFDSYGEVDFNTMLTFKRNNKPIMVATLNLLQDGFSRRSWSQLPEDTYKGN